MDAIKFLKQEHSQFRKTLKQLKKIDNEATKLKKFFAFCQELTLHEKMEQTVWYPALRKDKELKKIIPHLISEERSAAQTIKRFKKMEYGFMWHLRFYKFSHDVDHHAKEEETALFPEVRKKLTKAEINALGVKMRKYKLKHKK